ncbi:MAG: DEAD/DEAH box helicase, partial [Deltaproteobacteria bacterium]|nr:DEAD/DEAH box helicase [Deltaproteobacteria bacterium]
MNQTLEYGIHDILREIRKVSFSEREKGRDFERLMKLWFRTDPCYNILEEVWLWEEFPARKELGGHDLGIDLVAKTLDDQYWAIQCKCYDENAVMEKAQVDSFLANSMRSFPDALGEQRRFSELFWVDTTRREWGGNARKAIDNLTLPFHRIALAELENSAADWKRLHEGLYGGKARRSGKQPREHQQRAIAAARRHFVEEGNARGKLIMACGTGKTYTALKIAEDLTDPANGFILFLVPSIALLGQTLNAWMSDKSADMYAVCVCSDAKASRRMAEEDAPESSPQDLAVPASTSVRSILRQLQEYGRKSCRTVIFSTYQSIDVVSKALRESGRILDLCICDEAHRTTGVKLKNREEPDFTKVHDNVLIPAARRLYMTATPRLYRESAKVKAAESNDILCSMDDENLYGKEFHRLSFNEAVGQGLLCDYKVLVLTVSEEDVPKSIARSIRESAAQLKEADRPKELDFDDATKIIGCINGLSKRIRGDNGVTKEQDPALMRRAVVFCQTINPTKSNPHFSSTQVARYFPRICEDYRTDLPEAERNAVVRVEAQHVDGTMDAAIRNERLAWLKAESGDPLECRVLCNVRCLSEGVDVPALDAVIFLSPRNSEVEVVQSVGRVMRTFGKNTSHEKRYGYIIIPVIVPSDCTPEAALADNERFKVVWTILNALRSHDEQFNAHVNQIALNTKRSERILVAGVPVSTQSGTYPIGGGGERSGGNVVREDNQSGGAVSLDAGEVGRQLDLRFGLLRDGIYARLVEKVGDRLYWENWARSVGEIAQKFIERIERLARENSEARRHLKDFVAGLKRNINPGVNEKQAVEMLAQHLITRPVFDALFSEYQFVHNNAVSRSMQAVLDVLEKEGVGVDAEGLAKFYESVRVNVGKIDNLEGRQTIIKNLYEKFFKGAFPLTVEKLGIVYTPVECVDFIIHSVEDILRKEFGTSLTEENVHILDPFAGTGTFITRLLQSGLIEKQDMLRKYKCEIHCNEIVLLAYYVADVNIEAVYHDIMRPERYETYDGICLTDTFQLNEQGGNDTFSQIFPENSERVLEHKRTPIRVIIGNPPYSVGQKSANDNAQNLSYPALDRRIAETYAAKTQTTNKNSLYDSYIKAFRWASDKILACPDG